MIGTDTLAALSDLCTFWYFSISLELCVSHWQAFWKILLCG